MILISKIQTSIISFCLTFTGEEGSVETGKDMLLTVCHGHKHHVAFCKFFFLRP